MKQMMIFYPVIAMFLLTACVWAYMYFQRLSFMMKHKVDPQSVDTPEKMSLALPSHVHYASNNLKNLFELPIIFYLLAIMLYQLQIVDSVYYYCAWAYVLLRTLHSVTHCFVNRVKWRFTAYFLSSLFLWFAVIRLAFML